MPKNKAWIQYTKQGEIVPGSLIVSPRRPVNGVWYEVVTDICCDTEPPFGLISSKQKAFVKYDASGNIVPGSLVLTDGRLPRPGIWKEVYIDICCSTLPTTTTTTVAPYEIGDPLNGGYIAYLDNTGLHGFVANLVGDNNTLADWGSYGTLLGVTGTSIGLGQVYTPIIRAADPSPTTAANIILSQYPIDWYLPARDELEQIIINRALMPFIPSDPLAFPIINYWSSSECSDLLSARIQVINTINNYVIFCDPKFEQSNVIAIKYF
jgi:hypothetical protein